MYYHPILLLTNTTQASAMSVKGLFFKRLTGIICDPQNLSIKQAMREQVLAAFNTWQNGPSPNIISVPANQESCLGNSLSVAVGDHYERAALGYVNVVGIPNTYYHSCFFLSR